MFGGNKDRNTADNHILLLLSKGGEAAAAAEESSDDQENNKNNNNPEEREGEGGMGDHLIREESARTKMTMIGGVDGGFSSSSSPKPQELTLSYLCCANSHISNKGKELLMLPSSHDNNNNKNNTNRADVDDDGEEEEEQEEQEEGKKWVVERDFLNMTQTKSSKRPIQEQEGEEETEREKKPKLDESTTLNLSLALPVVSLSFLTPASNSNPLLHDNNNNNNHNASAADPPVMKINQQPRPQLPGTSNRSIQSLAAAPAPSNNNHNLTQTTYSNDFTAAASISYSYSQPFSHNPSCSLTRNSFENYEYSVGRDDQIWCGGEGTNGSVHSRFRPIGDGIIALNANNTNNNQGGAGGNGGLSLMQQGNRVTSKDLCNNDSVYRTTSSDNISFFPSELPARPRLDAHSGDSRRRGSENLRALEDGDGGVRIRKLSRPERILREIVSESIPVMGQIIQELTEETLESTKACLKEIIIMPEKREELLSLQNRLERRSDLTKEALSKCQKDQLEILVAVKMGLESFLSGKVCLSGTELVEIFLFMRCRNVNCKSILPVDDCDCKFCSGNKGFCSSCMCPVCMKFDCANNTCSWVGCDVCSHWCHAACGIQKNLIRPGPSLKGPSGTTEMLFHCIGCNHASEMFGFVKDVFLYCAKNWNMETLTKELDCVRKIFKASEDSKGKELRCQAEELHSRLESRIISPSDACNMILHYFNYGTSAFPASSVSAKELMPADSSLRKDVAAASIQPTATSVPPKYSVYSMTSLTGRRDSLSNGLHPNDLKAALVGELKGGDDLKFGKLPKSDGLDSLESIVRIKEAEARMFQSKADEARREAEGYRLMIRAKSEEMEEEYAEKLSKLCLQETEDRRRKKLEELKLLENSHCDYFKMKLRMQAEIAGLLERMETTKQQWV